VIDAAEVKAAIEDARTQLAEVREAIDYIADTEGYGPGLLGDASGCITGAVLLLHEAQEWRRKNA
jgi:hypothetical protein